jgi:hypothetical protein
MKLNLVEQVKVVQAHAPVVLNSTTATFGLRADTRDYDSAVIELNVGKYAGPATLSAILYEQETDDGDLTACPVTLGNFGELTGTSNQVKIGGIETKNYKRYLSLRLQASQSRSANPTISVAANFILGKSDSNPVSNSAVFDVTGDA